MPKLIDLRNQRFGKLLVIERDTTKKGTYWICKCDCGKIISARKDQLTRSTYPKRSCGCDSKEKSSQVHLKDEIGKVYGYLTVLYRTEDLRPGEARWHCKCKCGKECDVSGAHLRNGTVQSCGCKKYESHNGINEIGKKYGKLLVLERSARTDGTHIFWKCKCDCGNFYEVNGVYLRSGVATNCGCERSAGEQKIVQIFQDFKIPFKREYTFPDLIGDGGGRLRFDFGVLNEEGELLYLIEYDGIQHFQSECFGANEEDFKKLQKYDKMKNDYCFKNNIKLIRIPYTKIKNLELKDLIL